MTACGKHFCILPFVHIHMESSGDLSPCCINSTAMGNVNDGTLQDLWQSEKYRQLRTAMLNDAYIPGCEICYSQERGKHHSLRTHSNEKFARFIERAAVTPDDPVYFDLRFSNLCNLKCRSCEHKSSSLWFDDAKALGLAADNQALIKASNDSASLLQQIRNYLPNAVEFYFAGGEPLVMEEHYALLDMLIAEGRTDVRLVYNSNFMKVQFRGKTIFDFWRHFCNVELCISLDAINETASYVRKGTRFADLVENRRLLGELTPHIKVACTPTVSLLNIGSLDKLLQFILDRKFCDPGKIHLNILEYPLYYNIKAAPQHVKNLIRNRLDVFSASIAHHAHLTGQIANVLQYLSSGDLTGELEHFREVTLKLDALRGEDYKHILADDDPARLILEQR